jgi:hypothetical protein
MFFLCWELSRHVRSGRTFSEGHLVLFSLTQYPTANTESPPPVYHPVCASTTGRGTRLEHASPMASATKSKLLPRGMAVPGVAGLALAVHTTLRDTTLDHLLAAL